MQMKDIKTLAKDLNISKESIYKKVNGTLQNELQDHKFKKNGKLYIDDIGESLILQSLRRDNEENEQVPENEAIEVENTDIVIDNVITNDIQNLEKIKFLEAQLQEKENHIVIVKEQLQNKDIEIKELKESNIKHVLEIKQEHQEHIIERLEQELKPKEVEIRFLNEKVIASENQINELKIKVDEKDTTIKELSISKDEQIKELIRSNQNLEILLKIEKDKQQSIIDAPVEQSKETKKSWFKSLFNR